MSDSTIKTGQLSDAEWKEKLSAEQYAVLRQCGTEAPFTGKYYKHDEDGTYLCAACGASLFGSDTKFESGSGWPSYYKPVDEANIAMSEDGSLGTSRTEVKCATCGGHLGHVFDDGPTPTGLRYCINSAALNFKKKDV
ncbi:MAG: peptide-methionine (R)-S-oxide reductase MsrB [Patescibacteria group bacterium]|jgi:peptide-methionine (R)-S-oxide reductase